MPPKKLMKKIRNSVTGELEDVERTPEEIKRAEQEGKEFIQSREKLASKNDISSRRAAELLVPSEEQRLKPILEQQATDRARQIVGPVPETLPGGNIIREGNTLTDDELAKIPIEQRPRVISSFTGKEIMAPQITTEEASLFSAYNIKGTLGALGGATVSTRILSGFGSFVKQGIFKGGARGATELGAAKLGTVRSVLKTSSLINKITGISIVSWIVKEPIQNLLKEVSGVNDIDISLSDSANDMTDLTTEMDMGLTADEALNQLINIQDNLSETNKALHTFNTLSVLFYKKKGYAQQRDALKLLKRARLMQFQITRNQILGNNPNVPAGGQE